MLSRATSMPVRTDPAALAQLRKGPATTSFQSLRNSGDDVFATLFQIPTDSQTTDQSSTGSTKTISRLTTAESFFLPAPIISDLRPGEKRFRQPVSPSFHNPRGQLTKLFSATVEDSELSQTKTGATAHASQRRSLEQALNQPINASALSNLPSGSSTDQVSSILNITVNRASAKSPAQLDAVFRKLDGLPTTSRKSAVAPSRAAFLVNTVESASKKRKLDGTTIGDDSLNLSCLATPSARPAEVIRLETEIKRLQFERDSANKLVETERLRTEEHLDRRRREEEEVSTKTAEMWSEAEKIIAENDRLKARIEKADLDAIASRKKYEEQIATIKMEHIDKERQQDTTLREIRVENLSMNEKLRSLAQARGTLAEENDLLKKRLLATEQLAAQAQGLKGEVHNLNSQLQASAGQLADLKKANALLSNLSDEMRQYRELQVAVPLLQKDNQKLREKAALAKANEDKILSLQETVKGYEERQCRFYDLELENEQLRSRMAEWDAPDVSQTPTKKPEGIQKLIDKVVDLEADRKRLGDELARKIQALSEAAAGRKNLERQVTEIKAELELSDSVRARLEQSYQETSSKLAATQTERDTLKLIKETIDSSTTRRDPLTQTKIHDLEERANRTQTLAADFEQMYEKESSDKKQLTSQLMDLQNRYNEELSRSQSLAAELENLRKKDLSATGSSLRSDDSSFVREVKGDYDPFAMQVITLANSPADVAEKRYLEEASRVMEENKVLQEKLAQVRATGSYPSDLTMRAEEFVQGPGEQLEELKKQLEKVKQQKQNDFNSFKKTSNNFRQICKDLLGWHVRVDSNRVVFRLPDSPANDAIVFERDDESKPWELRPTDFTSAHTAFVNEFLQSHNSPPGFFARIVLQALSERTLICPT